MSTKAQQIRAEDGTPETELPEGWELCQAGNVINIRNGYAFSSKDFRSEGVPLIRQGNLGGDALTLDKCVFLDESYLGLHSDFMLTKGDMLIGMSGSIGKLCVYNLDEPGLQNQRTGKIEPILKGTVEPRFIYHYFRAFVTYLLEKGKGLGVANVSASDIESLDFFLPPLAEQKRIVEKADQVFSAVDRAHNRVTRVQESISRFRQAVLAAACSGKLTEDWRSRAQNSEDATALLGRMQAERQQHWSRRHAKRKYIGPEPVLEEHLPDIPHTWCWTNFDHCSWEITVGHVGPMKDQYVSAGVPFLRSQNVRPLCFDSAGLVYVPPRFDAQLAKSKLRGGELLVVRSGANTGDCCVLPPDVGPANCSDLVITRPLSGLVAEYGALYVNSPVGRARLTMNETGIAQPHFNIGAMRVKAFPLPPLEEQREIVRRVEALFKLADAIEKRVAAATLRAEKLTQAILAKAFRGELVPTEAELARREGRDYEPASVLLERIKKERETASEEKPKKGKRVGVLAESSG